MLATTTMMSRLWHWLTLMLLSLLGSPLRLLLLKPVSVKVARRWLPRTSQLRHLHLCEDGGVTITWTITDLCSTTTTSATFSVVPPTPVTPAERSGPVVDACDYDNDVPAVALANLNAALAAWVAAQTAAY